MRGIERNVAVRRHRGMNAPLKGWCLVGLAACVALIGRGARASDAPLLVVVEAPPALDADAAEIRRVIGGELRSPTVAPTQNASEVGDRTLIIALERDRMTMSLHTNDASPVVRAIRLPAERDARLRAIAWLAGNLVRDQVSPILSEAPPEPPPDARLAAPVVAADPHPSRRYCRRRQRRASASRRGHRRRSRAPRWYRQFRRAPSHRKHRVPFAG